MGDPIMRDLDRHTMSLDREQAIADHASILLEDEPDVYGHLSEEELFQVALEDLEARAEDAAISAYEDARDSERLYGPVYDE